MDLAKVHIRDTEGRLQALSAPTAQRIFDAASRGESFVTDTDTNDSPFVYDFRKMVRFDARAGESEAMIIEVPWRASTMGAIVNRDKSLRRPVLEMAVDRIRTGPILASILATKGLPTCQIRENPHLSSGHTSYNNFIESLLALCANDHAGAKRYRNILKAASDDSGEKRNSQITKGGLRVVFHGTGHQVMDKILQEGLDPSFRRDNRREDYFGITYQTSKPYTLGKTSLQQGLQGAYKLLVFIVTGWLPAVHVKGPAIKVASNKEQLPIAEITITE